MNAGEETAEGQQHDINKLSLGVQYPCTDLYDYDYDDLILHKIFANSALPPPFCDAYAKLDKSFLEQENPLWFILSNNNMERFIDLPEVKALQATSKQAYNYMNTESILLSTYTFILWLEKGVWDKLLSSQMYVITTSRSKSKCILEKK